MSAGAAGGWETLAGRRSSVARGGGGRVAVGLTVVLVSPAVTAISGLIMVLLFFSELQYYLTKEVSTADGAGLAPGAASRSRRATLQSGRSALALAPGGPRPWAAQPAASPPRRPAVRGIFLCPDRGGER